MRSVSVQSLTGKRAPRLPYPELTKRILPGWDVSIVFIKPAPARLLNRRLRGKRYTPNVLSYQVGEKSGEVIICLAQAAKEAASFAMSEREFTLYLLIHGLLHLKGERHGATMEQRERALLRQVSAALLSTHVSKNRNRHRHRHLSGKAGRRRGAD